LQNSVDGLLSVAFGIVSVVLGLSLLLEGFRWGLMPLGSVIGSQLPTKYSINYVMGFAFFLGLLVTFAEPAISSLQLIGENLQPGSYPGLYILLHPPWSWVLLSCVGIGVGFASMIGMYRVMHNSEIGYFLLVAVTPTILIGLVLSISTLSDSIPLAWDCGAITTGPVTVPLILSIGSGLSKRNAGLSTDDSGLGVVSLASLYPVMVVQFIPLLLLIQFSQFQPETLKELPEQFWLFESPWIEIWMAFRAVLPLSCMILFVIVRVLRAPLPHVYLSSTKEICVEESNANESTKSLVYPGLVMTLTGMILFNLGLTYGLGNLGRQVGSSLPSAFSPTINFGGPIFSPLIGKSIVILFTFVLGLLSTLAEPALALLATQVNEITHGMFPRWLMIGSVSIGVGSGLTLGVIQIMFGINFILIIYPLYVLALVLTWFSKEDFRCVAWDCGGVTTGPVTVPLVLALGVALGTSLDAPGFGLLALASIGPIISVMIAAIFNNLRKSTY